MLVSPSSLKSPPPRARAQTRTSGRVASPCVLCSPPAREIVSSPFDSQVKTCDDPVALMVETWCYPTLVSPAGRQCSVMQLQQHQGAGPVDIGNPFLEDEQWDMEAMALCTIAGQLEDEEEEEEEEGEALDSYPTKHQHQKLCTTQGGHIPPNSVFQVCKPYVFMFRMSLFGCPLAVSKPSIHGKAP